MINKLFISILYLEDKFAVLSNSIYYINSEEFIKLKILIILSRLPVANIDRLILTKFKTEF